MSNGQIQSLPAPGLEIDGRIDAEQDENGIYTSPSLTRSASYTHIAVEEQAPYVPQRTDSLRRSLSEDVLNIPQPEEARRKSMTGKAERASSPYTSTSLESFKETQTNVRSQNSVVAAVNFEIGPEETTENGVEARTEIPETPPIISRQWPNRSISGPVSSFARRSWASTSRSPSSSPRKLPLRQSRTTLTSPSSASLDTKEHLIEDQNGGMADRSAHAQVGNAKERDSSLGRKLKRHSSRLLTRDVEVSAPAVPRIPKSVSAEKLPSLFHKRPAVGASKAPAVSRTPSYERLHSAGTETTRKKDELYGTFRSLDSDFHKFQSRPSTTKITVVRTVLLPFLRTYAEHASTWSLRPEDLDRRTVILNKWWTGLLEMLNGRHGESISGNDRPAVLEAVTALMVRPEWTTSPSRPSRIAKPSLKSRSTTSLGSNMSNKSGFLADSVLHNVRNIFTQNLFAQMAYVVDKMSARNVAASVVTFCGKATAYAFFYCDGVADILVRLWNISSRTLRRLVSQTGGRTLVGKVYATANMFHAFPPCLQPLSFKSMKSMMMCLRSRPHLPAAMAYVHWHGPWTSRWAGQDSDLFFVFVKFYIELACRHLPRDVSQEERMTAPGWALVHAQLLVVLDSVLQAPGSQSSSNALRRPPPTTFNEMLGEADAKATMLTLPRNGSFRSMAENRLIMLLRDCLSTSTVMGGTVQHVFAESIDLVLKAAVSGTSVFDHDACFTLCDFLEEAMAILSRYHRGLGSEEDIRDWPFWLEVYKRFMESHHNMTEIRLLAFVFSMWGVLTIDAQRREDICVGWLLGKDVFQRQFNHWCPMVRAFYMRLVIWRISRLDPRAASVNGVILETLRQRLGENWQYLLHSQLSARSRGCTGLSTAACSPAPSRCLLIVRDDVQTAPSGMFLTFDSLLSAGTNKIFSDNYRGHGHQNLSFEALASSKPSSHTVRRRWGLLEGISLFNRPRHKLTARNGEPSEERTVGRNDPSLINIKTASIDANLKRDVPQIVPAVTSESLAPHRALSFKFALEWTDKESDLWGTNVQLCPPRLPRHTQTAREIQEEKPTIFTPREPEGVALTCSKYAGRAFAEWTMLIDECQSFFERRKAEGVPFDHLVETPMLSVDPFRKN